MKIHFYLRYATQYGQSLFLSLNDDPTLLPLQYLNAENWHLELDIDPKKVKTLQYRYHFRDRSGAEKTEWGNDRILDFGALKMDFLEIRDFWNEAGAVENVYFSQPFQQIFFKNTDGKAAKSPAGYTHIFKVKAPVLQPNEAVCLLGHGIGLRNWDISAPIVLGKEDNWWSIRLDLSQENFPLGYKYGIWNTQSNQFVSFEEGSNRTLYTLPAAGGAILHDGFMRLPVGKWRGAGVAIPVFSLRSNESFGVGEFADLPKLADWGQSVGLKILQLLPINDTSATDTWVDSYPYSAVSAFALHPIYLNLAAMAGKKNATILKPFAAKQKEINDLPAVDYAAVLQLKWEIIRLLYPLMKAEWLRDPEYYAYYEENKHWLVPYAAFSYLRLKNGTSDFNQWTSHQNYTEEAIEQLVSPKTPHFDEVAIHYFVQWHLHVQLKAAVEYAHGKGLALKGDIPIGIYRYSCDAWVAPELYNMDKQAGAPPDDFAEKGQNWGFPTYNWARMKEDDFAWWKQRFAQMRLYFDAFRIDHILGFFRIWSIPMHAVEGIMGYFVPAIPITEREFHDAGIGFNFDRLCKPFITDQVLMEQFGEMAELVVENFLEPIPDAGRWSGASQYNFKAEFDTQRKVLAFLEAQPVVNAAPPPEVKEKKTTKKAKNTETAPDSEGMPKGLGLNEQETQQLKKGLFNLLSNVILFADDNTANAYHFRFGIDKTSAFRSLPSEVREKLNAIYVNYFFRRQDEFWQKEAMEKLPALKRSTNMLICGEDLGLVPACVPDVMRELGMLSLEIQRMPKASGSTFFHPKDAPYLSVVTPSTHDMSTIRGWWEESRPLSQRFFNEVIGFQGNAPFFCEPWLNRLILEQHMKSPAMWAIFQLQDLMGMDGGLRRDNPNDERINVPANPTHYWQYRMHISLEKLMEEAMFNQTLRGMVSESGRT